MATFDYFSAALYAPTDALITTTDDDGTVDDGDGADTTFEVGPPVDTATVTITGFGTLNVEYAGQTVVDSELAPVALITSGVLAGNYVVLSSRELADVTFPPTLTMPPADTSPFTTCFAQGTMIACPGGDRAVQDLAIGDDVVTAGGQVRPVKWVGVQTVISVFSKGRARPVRIRAGALGMGLPHSDLTVTADHAMLVDGVLCNAGALVNGSSIVRVPLAEMGGQFTVYHIETEAHEIILANGAPAETFIDNVSRRVFDNYAEFEAMYGDVPEMQELPLPRALSARQVPAAIRARLAAATAA
ncbi:Hint domain-containing protein [Seohaeicola saemankumensis]|nr:Hint domain-containing protein [Seohaeicola saemankumensis]MCA0870135.1 Hint domain-containing protein [Seohaeicola saemankumensis]